MEKGDQKGFPELLGFDELVNEMNIRRKAFCGKCNMGKKNTKFFNIMGSWENADNTVYLEEKLYPGGLRKIKR